MNGLPDSTPANRAGPRWFVRGVAVLVGLANLFVALLLLGDPMCPGISAWEYVWEYLTLNRALAPVLVAVLSGLATAEIVLRVFGRWVFSERFGQRYAAAALGVFLGGMLMSGLLFAVFAFKEPGTGSVPLDQQVTLVLYISIQGVVGGGVVGFLEGMVLAYPLAYILGRFRNGG